jgi:hypothetical protein
VVGFEREPPDEPAGGRLVVVWRFVLDQEQQLERIR